MKLLLLALVLSGCYTATPRPRPSPERYWRAFMKVKIVTQAEADQLAYRGAKYLGDAVLTAPTLHETDDEYWDRVQVEASKLGGTHAYCKSWGPCMVYRVDWRKR